jgi:hypothetical protein
MKAIISIIIIILFNLSYSKSQTNDSLNNLLRIGFYKDMINIFTPEYIEVFKNTPFKDLNSWRSYSRDTDMVELFKLDKKLDKYFKKLRNIDTCTKYFDTFLCNRGSWIVDEFKQLIERGFHCYLNNSVYDFKKDIDELINELKESDSIKVFNATADTIDGRYIPKNLEDAFQQLDSLLEPYYKERFILEDEETAVRKEHHGLGMSIRNSWCLWGSSRLQRYIYSEYGIKQPDSQSSFILTLYYRKLKGLDLNIEQIKAKIQEQEAKQEEAERRMAESE